MTVGGNCERGRYIYCVVEGVKRRTLGGIGIEGCSVYLIPYRDIGAAVHRCSPKPYESKDATRVQKWAVAHHRVVEAFFNLGTVIPVTFDTIVQGGDEKVKMWLNNDYERLKDKLCILRGKAEFGVQIFWEPKILGEKIANISSEIKALREEMAMKLRAMAYFYNMKIEEALKKQLEAVADRTFKDFYALIRRYAEDIRVEKLKKDTKRQMLMNIALLMEKSKASVLGRELAKIKEAEGFDIRFTGPWPPYSFV